MRIRSQYQLPHNAEVDISSKRQLLSSPFRSHMLTGRKRCILFAFLCIQLATHQLFAQKSLLEDEQEAIRQAVGHASFSVVQIETFGGQEIVNNERVAEGPSTGTVVADGGWIVTSLFQFRNQPASITVVLANGKRSAARLIAKDFSREIALLKIDPDPSLVVAQASPRDQWQVGQWAIALGKTFDPGTPSRSVGILSAVGRIWNKAIQTDAKISPNNYGGPLIDLYGRVMGVVVPIDPGIATEGEVHQWYDSGIGFAVPLTDIHDRLATLRRGVDIHSGKLGVRPKNRDDFGSPVELAGVVPGSPAAKAGFQAGDEIIRIAGQPISKLNEFKHALGTIDADQIVKIEYRRSGKNREVECKLVREIPVYHEPYLGLQMEVASLNGEDTDPPAKIAWVAPGSPAAKAGIVAGQSIDAISSSDVRGLHELAEKLSFVDYREPLMLSIRDKTSEGNKQVKVSPVAWPDSILPLAPAILLPNSQSKDPEGESKVTTGVISLPMGDVPNKAIAFVPPNYRSDLEYGMLTILPEAGEVDQKLWLDAWEPFCRDHRWIVVILTSADAKAWTREEIPLVERVIGQIAQKYRLDARRICAGGVGAGGSLAMIATLQNKKKLRGIWMVQGRIPQSMRFPDSEPQEASHFLLAGSSDQYSGTIENLQKRGYPATLQIDATDKKVFPKEGPIKEIQQWLRSLEQI